MSTESLCQLPPLPPDLPRLLDAEVIRLRTKEANFYIPQPSDKVQSSCITCKGEGTFLWFDSEYERVTYECPCINQWRLYAAFTSANIPIRYQRLSWSDLGNTEFEARQFVADYLVRTEAHIRLGVGLFLHGSTGTGKSSLAAFALKNLVSQGYDCLFITFNELIGAYTSGWRDKDERAWFQRRVKNSTVLVVDDIGREYGGRGEFIKSMVDEVIRHRVSAMKPTILTSNFDATSISEMYGESIYWFMREGVKTYEFNGEDFRKVSDKRLDDELEGGLVRPVVVE